MRAIGTVSFFSPIVRRLGPLAAVVLALLFAYTAAAADGSIRLEARGGAAGKRLYAMNKSVAPVSVAVAFHDLRNVSIDRPLPIYAVVPPRAEVVLCRLSPKDRKRGWSYRYTTRSTLGAFDAVHDASARYRLPYREGTAHTVGQAPGGPITTHTTIENQYAIDIDMPLGTPILAMRGGLVIAAESSHTEGGPDKSLLKKANYVRILHDDGTIGNYAHLQPGGVSVAIGQRVEAGEQIGLSGATGYARGPHLHFAVSHVRLRGGEFELVSEPITFYNGVPAMTFSLMHGQRVTASYTTPPPPAKAPPVPAGPLEQRHFGLEAPIAEILADWWWAIALLIPVVFGAGAFALMVRKSFNARGEAVLRAWREKARRD